MAKSDQNPLTSLFSGTVGSLVFYTVRNQQRIRTKPQRVRNPRSPKQNAHRSRLAVATSLAAVFKDAYLLGYALVDPDVAPRHLFVKHVYHDALSDSALLLPNRLLLSHGTLRPFNPSDVAADLSLVSIRWAVSGAASDHLCLCLYNHTRARSCFFPDQASRAEGHTHITVPSDWQSDHLYLYAFWHNPATHKVSDSVVVAELNAPDSQEAAHNDLKQHLDHLTATWRPRLRKSFLQSISKL